MTQFDVQFEPEGEALRRATVELMITALRRDTTSATSAIVDRICDSLRDNNTVSFTENANEVVLSEPVLLTIFRFAERSLRITSKLMEAEVIETLNNAKGRHDIQFECSTLHEAVSKTFAFLIKVWRAGDKRILSKYLVEVIHRMHGFCAHFLLLKDYLLIKDYTPHEQMAAQARDTGGRRRRGCVRAGARRNDRGFCWFDGDNQHVAAAAAGARREHKGVHKE